MQSASRLTGDWSGVRNRLQHASKTCRSHLQQALLREGVRLADNIKINITQGGRWAHAPFAPNADSTIQRKKSSAPLICSGDLRNSVTTHRLNPDTVLVGIAGQAGRKQTPIGHYIAAYARVHEFGAQWTDKNGKEHSLPKRSFIWSVVTHTRKSRQSEWKRELNALFQSKPSPRPS